MKYIIFSTKDKSETAFFMKLFKKMNKNAVSFPPGSAEDILFIKALKKAGKAKKGSLSNVKAHFSKLSESERLL